MKNLCVILFQYWPVHYVFFCSSLLFQFTINGFFLDNIGLAVCVYFPLKQVSWALFTMNNTVLRELFVSFQLLTCEILSDSNHLSFRIKKCRQKPLQSRWLSVTIKHLFCFVFVFFLLWFGFDELIFPPVRTTHTRSSELERKLNKKKTHKNRI